MAPLAPPSVLLVPKLERAFEVIVAWQRGRTWAWPSHERSTSTQAPVPSWRR